MIIGFSGKYGSGKNSAATILRSQLFSLGENNCLPVAIKQMAFADALKRLVAAVTGQSIVTFTSPQGKNTLHDGSVHDFSLESSLFPHHSQVDAKEFLAAIHKGENSTAAVAKCISLTKEVCRQHITYGTLLQIVGTDIWRHHYSNNIWMEIVKREASSVNFLLITDVRFPDEAEIVDCIIRVNRDPISTDGTRDRNHISETALDQYQNFHWKIANNSSIEALTAALYPIATAIFNC